MKNITLILLFSVITISTSIGQNLDGLYFEDLPGTVWISGANILDPNFIKPEGFEISLLKKTTISENLNALIWKFSDNKILITSNSDSIMTLNYEIDRINKKVKFKNSIDSISFNYISVSTGSFVSFYPDRTIKIIGEAINSKDGAIIIADQSVYRVHNKKVWNSKYERKKIKVHATIINEELMTAKKLGYDLGTILQGRLGKTTTIKLNGKVKIKK